MDPGVWAEIDQLRKLKTADLRAKYQEAFGVETRSSNKQFLFRRIAWRLQMRAEGDLSERARRRAAEIADEGDVRLRAPRDFVAGRCQTARQQRCAARVGGIGGCPAPVLTLPANITASQLSST